MVLPDGQPKGMKMVLEERGIDTAKMKAADMRLILSGQESCQEIQISSSRF